MEDVEIIEQEFIEFEFEEYSVLYNKKDLDWSLKYYDDEYGETIISIDDESFDEEKDLFEKLNFNQTGFFKLKEFVNENNK